MLINNLLTLRYIIKNGELEYAFCWNCFLFILFFTSITVEKTLKSIEKQNEQVLELLKEINRKI